MPPDPQPTPYAERYDEAWFEDRRAMERARHRARRRLLAAHPEEFDELWRSDPRGADRYDRPAAKLSAAGELARRYPDEWRRYVDEERPRPKLTHTAAQVAARDRNQFLARLASPLFHAEEPTDPLEGFAADDPMRAWY